MDIKGLVEILCEKHHTRDPFEIAEQRNIIVLFEPLGSIRGFYSKSLRQKFIHINHDLSRNQALFTCGHELGHSIMHPNMNTPFLRTSIFFSVNKLEVQANQFSVCMIYSDEELMQMLACPIRDAAFYMGVPENLAEYRMKNIELQKHDISSHAVINMCDKGSCMIW